jgi:hypothetical protein
MSGVTVVYALATLRSPVRRDRPTLVIDGGKLAGTPSFAVHGVPSPAGGSQSQG